MKISQNHQIFHKNIIVFVFTFHIMYLDGRNEKKTLEKEVQS